MIATFHDNVKQAKWQELSEESLTTKTNNPTSLAKNPESRDIIENIDEVKSQIKNSKVLSEGKSRDPGKAQTKAASGGNTQEHEKSLVEALELKPKSKNPQKHKGNYSYHHSSEEGKFEHEKPLTTRPHSYEALKPSDKLEINGFLPLTEVDL